MYNAVSRHLYEIKEKLILGEKNPFDSDFNNHLEAIIADEWKTIKAGQEYYRARIYKEKDVYDKFHDGVFEEDAFQGYDSENSFVNKTNCSAGRGNKKGDVCLYVSSDEKTCALEVCSKENVAISIAKIRVKEDMKAIDLSSSCYVTTGTNHNVTEKINAWKVALANEMNAPAINSNGTDYVLTQYICDYFRKKGLDGVVFHSTGYTGERQEKNAGKNVIIFNYEKCEAISSKLYLTNKVDIELKPFKARTGAI